MVIKTSTHKVFALAILMIVVAMVGCGFFKSPAVPATLTFAACVIEHQDEGVDAIIKQCGGEAEDIARLLTAEKKAAEKRAGKVQAL